MTETSAPPGELRPRGLLNRRAAADKLSLSLYPPSHDLAPFVQQYWAVRWDLRGQEPYVQENIPHPCVSVVMERGGAWAAYGVVTRKFACRLVDEGRVLGIKFRPGGFHPFLKSPLSRLTDRTVPLATVPGAESSGALAREVDGLDDEPARIARVRRSCGPCSRGPIPRWSSSAGLWTALWTIARSRGWTRPWREWASPRARCSGCSTATWG